MMIADIAFAFTLALVLAALIVPTTGHYRGKRSFKRGEPFIGFIILFLCIWALGLWITPAGPALMGIYWMPQLLGGLIIFFIILTIIAALISAKDEDLQRTDSEPGATPGETPKEPEAPKFALSIFFWIVVVALTVIITGGYWVHG